jgi:hypothetical protein
MVSNLETIRLALQRGRVTVNPLTDGSGVLVDLQGQRLLALNASGMLLVQAIECGEADEHGLVRALASGFLVDITRAEADTREFVRRLAELVV